MHFIFTFTRIHDNNSQTILIGKTSKKFLANETKKNYRLLKKSQLNFLKFDLQYVILSPNATTASIRRLVFESS